jgi:hypothetical protein
METEERNKKEGKGRGTKGMKGRLRGIEGSQEHRRELAGRLKGH